VFALASAQWLAGRTAAAPINDSAELFGSTNIPRLRIEIPPAGMEVLSQYEFRNRNSVARTNVLATVREGERVYTNVAIHLKGAMGSFRPVDDKPALTLNFDKYADGQRFHGLQKLHLNNSVQDATYVSEQICREMFLAAGVPTPRAAHAVVELNGRRLGLFVLVEGWNKQFLKRHFKNVQGNLWDGGFAQDITADLETNSGESPKDRRPLDALIAAMQEPDLTNRQARLEQVLDLDRFHTFLAMEIMLAHWDGYAQNRNNYRVFHDLDTRRLVFLPHGLDQMFGVWRTRPESSITPQLRGLVAKAVLHTPEGRHTHFLRMSQLLTNVFKVAVLTNRVQELAALVRPTLPNRSEALRHDRAVQALIDRIIRREQSVREQLAGLATPVQFGATGFIPLTRWDSKRDAGNPSFNRASVPFDTLQITANGGQTYGSWRMLVLLEPGAYRFEGRVRTQDLEFNSEVMRGGVCLRVSGERAAPMRSAVPEWTTLSYDFETKGLEDVELVCEMRASSGWAWFDAGSMKLVRKSSGKPSLQARPPPSER
jgi:spore coat protein H